MKATVKAKDINNETQLVLTVKSEDDFYDIEFTNLLAKITKLVEALKDSCELYHFEIEF